MGGVDWLASGSVSLLEVRLREERWREKVRLGFVDAGEIGEW